MFHIDSKIHKPNHELALEKAQEWCNRGFRFNRSSWSDITETAADSRAQLLKYGLKNPDSPKQLEWFLRSFNSLEIASHMYDIKKGGWDFTIEALSEVAGKFTGIPEINVLYEYKKAMGTARSFQTLEKHLKGDNIVHPKVKVTSTNRIMFVEPFLSGLPKKCKPFSPVNEDSLLISVDVKAQEPNIIVNWYGSPNLKEVAATETDIYTGVAKAALLPRVSVIEGSGKSITEAPKGVTWLWGKGDSLLHLENIHQSFLLDNPRTVIGVFESGKRRNLPIKWGAPVKGVATGVLDVAEGVDEMTFKLTDKARNEVKEVWNLLAYGGSLSSAKALCEALDGTILVDHIKNELRLSKKIEDDDDHFTYFGTELISDKRLGYRSVRNRKIQGTGADLMALLIERFYSEKRPEGVDIYLTRYDELVVEIPMSMFTTLKGEGVSAYLRDIFEHQVDDFTPFKVSIDFF